MISTVSSDEPVDSSLIARIGGAMTISQIEARNAFRKAVDKLAGQWLTTGLPSRQGLYETAEALTQLRVKLNVQGIWRQPPSMVTATLDDGLGQGLAVIEKYAEAIGMRLISLGLMQSPAVIIDACRRYQPDFLGLTVLQFDSEAELRVICQELPSKTRIVAGGPVYAGGSDFAKRTGTHYAAKNVADFLRIMLYSARCGENLLRPV
jgi:methylmalonyl-CoA mutase cobalamin-binding subunit